MMEESLFVWSWRIVFMRSSVAKKKIKKKWYFFVGTHPNLQVSRPRFPPSDGISRRLWNFKRCIPGREEGTA